MLFSSLFGRLVCLIVTLSSLPTAIAGGASGVYEQVGPIYQTYRIAVQTWGKDQKKILPGIPGNSHPLGGANFLEMIKYLDIAVVESTFKAAVTNLNDPDPHAVVDYARNKATSDERKSFFKDTPLPKIIVGSSKYFSEFLGQITTIVDSAYDKMNKEKRFDEIKQFRESLAECQKAALEIRQGELMGGTGGSDGLVRAIKRVWPGAVVVRNYKFYERVSNIRLYTVDVEETINKSPPGKFNAGGVVTFAANYGKTADYLPVEQEHYRVTEQHINLQTKERERLNGGC